MKFPDRILAPLVVLAAFGVALWGLNPSFYFDDSPEIITVASVLGIAHPPGYPLYTLLGRLLSLLPLGPTCLRVNLLAALSGTGTCLLLFILLRKTFQLPQSLAAAFALVWMAGATAYPAALSAKNGIYQMTALFILAVLASLLRSKRLLAFFLFGLSLTNHWMSMVPCLAGFGWLFYSQWKGRPLPVKELIRSLALLILGLSLYLYLPLRSNLDPVINWAHPVDLTNFWHHVTRYVDKNKDLTWDLGLWAHQGFYYLKGAFLEFNGLALLSIVGFVYLWKGQRDRALGLGLAWAGLFAAVCVFSKFSSGREYLMQNYSISSLALVPLLAALGWQALSQRFKGLTGFAGPGAWALGLGLLALGIPRGSQAGYTYSYDYLLNAWRATSRGAFFFCKGDVLDFPSWYFQIIDGKRPDLPILGGGSLPMDWYRIHLAEAHPGLVVPYPDHEKGKEYISGHLMLWIAENNPGHRLFFTFPNLKDDGMADRTLAPYGLVQEAFGPGTQATWEEGKAEQLWKDMRLRYFGSNDRFVDEVTWDQFLKDYGAARSWMGLHYGAQAQGLSSAQARPFYQKALPHLLWATLWDPQNGQAAMNVGLDESYLGEKEKALAWFLKTAEDDPKEADAYYFAGVMAHELGQDAEAQDLFLKAVDINPNHPGARQALETLKSGAGTR
jgi:tetratricopeptide (TPR) repeat protein